MRKPRVAEVEQPDHSSHTGKWQSQVTSIHALGYYDPCRQKLHGLVGQTGVYVKKTTMKDSEKE